MVYDASQDIKILGEIEHCLKRPQIWIGSIQLQKQYFWIPTPENTITKKEIEYIPGLFKIVSEIIDNSVDEVCGRGFGDTINIEYNFIEGTFKVADNGRGIPLEKHKEVGRHFPELVYAQLRAGSNFSDEKRITAGMNGVGATLTTIFSEFLHVRVKREGKIYDQSFKKNLEKISEPKIEKNAKQRGSGTAVFFKPDYKIFTNKLPIELLHKRCLELSVMFPKVTINLSVICKKDNDCYGCNTNTVYKNTKFENFVKMFGSQYSIYEDNKKQMKMAICHNKISEGFEFFSNINGVDTFRGGTHVDVIKEMFCEDMRDKIYKETKMELTNQDVAKNMIVIIFQTWNAPSFEGQTKEKFVNDKSIVKTFYDDVISSRRLTSMYGELSELKQAIINDVLLKNEKKSLQDLRKTQKTIDKKKIPKLIEASGRNRSLCSIYITEGDSAISNIATVRDPKTMAGLPLRGKVLNVFEESPQSVLENKEIQSIIAAIGLRIGESPFEIINGHVQKSNLSYGKIIIATDQDMDGYCIRCLLINFFFKFWPEIIEHGYVYILETPLYEIIDNKNKKTNYFYNKQEYDEYMLGKHSDSSKYEISYFKGLGSCGVTAWDYMVNKNPNLVQITVKNIKEAAEKLKLVFGQDAEVRKEWLTK